LIEEAYDEFMEIGAIGNEVGWAGRRHAANYKRCMSA
jgi:hypothetical protein